MSLPSIDSYVSERKEQALDTLFKILRQESISTQNKGMRECASLMQDLMREIGMEPEVYETKGHPILYGELKSNNPEAKTILLYGHYDVQPPDPLDHWQSPPFEPTIRDGRIFARGAGDNKGQIVAQLLGVKAYLDCFETLPVHLKFVIEGEEEMGSVHLPEFVEEHKDMLNSDLVYTADGSSHSSGQPLVLLGVRGMLSLEIEIEGAAFDNHSGNTGNIVPNPAWELVELLHTMRDSDGHVLVEGFYDHIRPATSEETKLLKDLPFNASEVGEKIGYPSLSLDGQSYHHKLTMEPTFNIFGMKSGYLDQGVKTITPSKASVKIDTRLVVDQDPADVFSKIEAHVKSHHPTATVRFLGSMNPSRTPVDTHIVQQAIAGIKEAFNQQPLIQPSLGGSLPDYVWTNILKAPSMLMPYANFDQRNHSPNENITLDHFFNGIRCTAHVIHGLGK
ncbi:M20/M25/M40 family metallo-hydrolase [Alkalicoccobacillus gibsonii]|uniref:M20/M25/M40 family metallo-hydrolase n=1 Tax=Alkalicoccobacillus gibsonii TaxID=79881 RepID=UPI003514AE5E